MSSQDKFTEAETLELFRVSLENATQQTEIASIMSEFGYDQTKIDEGKSLWEDTRMKIDEKKTEGDEKSAAYSVFTGKKAELAVKYRLHRKKAKVAFGNDPLTLKRLLLTGVMPSTYVKIMENYRKFYYELDGDTTLQSKLAVLKVPVEEIQLGKQLIAEIEAARIQYHREIGESQDATQHKDAAFGTLDKWMSEFYAVAKIALEDKPQLLEALGKVVK